LFSWIFKDYKRIIIAALLVIVAFLFLRLNSVSNQYHDYQQRAVDTLSVYQNKVGELYAMNDTYILDIKELKKVNEELYQEVKSLKDNPVVITKTEVVYQVDSVKMDSDTVYVYVDNNDTIYKNMFSKKDDWMNITGTTLFSMNNKSFETTLNNVSFNADITTNLIERDNKLYFVSKSSNPYMQINNIEGYMLSPEDSKVVKRHFDDRWALVVGAGPSLTIVNGQLKFVPALQLTLGYKLISF
jgi:FtsZ-binding cell division protein ZapB